MLSWRSVETGDEVIVDCKGQLVSVHVTSWMVRDPSTMQPKYMMAMMVPLEAKRKPLPVDPSLQAPCARFAAAQAQEAE